MMQARLVIIGGNSLCDWNSLQIKLAKVRTPSKLPGQDAVCRSQISVF